MTRNTTFTIKPYTMNTLKGKYGILKCYDPNCEKILDVGDTVHSIQIRVDRTLFSDTTRIYYCEECWNNKHH